jgi:hypothetical protein
MAPVLHLVNIASYLFSSRFTTDSDRTTWISVNTLNSFVVLLMFFVSASCCKSKYSFFWKRIKPISSQCFLDNANEPLYAVKTFPDIFQIYIWRMVSCILSHDEHAKTYCWLFSKGENTNLLSRITKISYNQSLVMIFFHIINKTFN